TRPSQTFSFRHSKARVSGSNIHHQLRGRSRRLIGKLPKVSRSHFGLMDDSNVVARWREESLARRDSIAEMGMVPILICLIFFIAALIAIRFLCKYIYNSILIDDETPSVSSMYSIMSTMDTKGLVGYSNKGYQHAEHIIP
ncbi:hypothetical protein PENTCL1PPCAC_28269, partial [Pristionchus entomophagus]